MPFRLALYSLFPWQSRVRKRRAGIRSKDVEGGRGYHGKQQTEEQHNSSTVEQQSSTVAQQPIDADFKLN